MNILLVVATASESQLIQRAFPFQQEEEWQYCDFNGGKLYLLTTGIGMVSTAYMLGKFLALRQIDLGINFGIAGSFDRELKPGDVVEIVTDSFTELGAEDGERWLDLEDMGFPQFSSGDQTFYNTFTNPNPSPFPIPKCTAITVNRTHGDEHSIDQVKKYWPAMLESMEGAAFFHAMIRAQKPFYAFRAISNYVEKRNRNAWDIPLAVRQIQEWLIEKLSFHLHLPGEQAE